MFCAWNYMLTIKEMGGDWASTTKEQNRTDCTDEKKCITIPEELTKNIHA